MTAKRCWVSFLGDESSDCSDGCITANTLRATELHTPNWWIIWHVNYISIKLFLKKSIKVNHRTREDIWNTYNRDGTHIQKIQRTSNINKKTNQQKKAPKTWISISHTQKISKWLIDIMKSIQSIVMMEIILKP